MTKEEYNNMLLDPRWKKRRRQIIKRDGKKCTKCGSTKHLEVHHIKYRNGIAPWEYNDDEMITLCMYCHGAIHGLSRRDVFLRFLKFHGR